MLVAEFPAVVPRICCAITFREEMLAFGEVAIRVIHEQGGDETIVAEVKFEVKEDQVVQPDPTQDFVMREGKFALEILGLNISGPGALKTRAFKGGDEIRLGALQIAPLPSLPAAQSD